VSVIQTLNLLSGSKQAFKCSKTLVSADKRLRLKGLRRVSCALEQSQISLKENLIDEFKNFSLGTEEVWHRDYGEIDSGNDIDDRGYISVFLDQIRDSLQWDKEGVTFDKVMLRREDNHDLDQFHADHFVSNPPKIRSKGVMERAIFNLNNIVRYFAVLNIAPEKVNTAIKDPYCLVDYENLLEEVQPIEIEILEIPPMRSPQMIHGICFDAFSTVHAGFGREGDLAAIVSNWSKISARQVL